jgi:AraC-like DNA-binding protein
LKKAYTKEGISDNQGIAVDPFLKKAMGVLEEHFREEVFGAKELADKLHLSRMQVHRKLKVLTNFSACQFINHFRLKKGKILLLKNELNISEVAFSCGFSDPGYFSKLFTKAYGVSPLHFKCTDLSR